MNHLKPHIVIAGRFFVFLFILSNAGFTTVLEHCTMQSESCCDSPACAMSCDRSSSANDGLSLDNGCHSLAIVGGRASNDGVSEKDTRDDVSKFTGLLPISLSAEALSYRDPSFITTVDANRPTFYLHPRKYLLHKALLN